MRKILNLKDNIKNYLSSTLGLKRGDFLTLIFMLLILLIVPLLEYAILE
ncbi:MAG: hypothetical protein V1808_05070 [Candidatus Daviesbacteria bacterium]